jgi:tRNA1(Val) A37 N6-methylase TrmN6
VNADTVLLAAAMRGQGGGRVIELGCGVGAALIAVAKASPQASFVGVERDPAFASFARENVVLNDVADRVRIVEGDALDGALDFGQFDRVFFNPPYDDGTEGNAPADARRGAHVEERPIGDWIKFWCNRMNARASLTLIHRTHRLAEILAGLEGRLGGIEIAPIRPNGEAEASRVIVRAWKGSRAPLKLLAGLDLHPKPASGEKYTVRAEAIFRGEAGIWPD